MVKRSTVREMDTLLGYHDNRCDECGLPIDRQSAKLVTDDTGKFPVCKECAAKYGVNE